MTVPERTCAGCGAKRPQRELVRFAAAAGSLDASAWCAGTPQYFEPGSDAFGQRLPFESTAPQRPLYSSPSEPSPP